MTAIVFDQTVNSENIARLLKELCSLNEPGIVLYLRSEGGDPVAAQPLIDWLNDHWVPMNITIIGFGGISSAAFDILWQTECPKKLLEGAWSLVHFTDIDGISMQQMLKDRLLKVLANEFKKQDDRLYEFLKSSKALTAQELKDLKAYKDVVLDYARLSRVLGIV